MFASFVSGVFINSKQGQMKFNSDAEKTDEEFLKRDWIYDVQKKNISTLNICI